MPRWQIRNPQSEIRNRRRPLEPDTVSTVEGRNSHHDRSISRVGVDGLRFLTGPFRVLRVFVYFVDRF